MAKPIVVAVISDLMFQSRVREQAESLGCDVTVVETPAELRAAIGEAVLVVIDLHIGDAWRDAAVAAGERSIPVLAFGRHTDAALLREAREAGINHVVPRSMLFQALPATLESVAID
jgi:hypothetical protein